MPHIAYGGTTFELRSGESVLDGLLRAGASVSHACKAGGCGSCLLRAEAPSAVPAAAQAGVKASWRARGYFLACLCHPDVDMTVTAVGAEVRVPATITALEALSDTVLRVRLATARRLDYRAGQFVTLYRADGLARSYSIASLPSEATVELHVRLLPNGRMSQWFATAATVGTTVDLQGPSGDCFYLDGDADQPLLLAGTGTGLAPLLGIARDALARGHRGPLHLFHGALTAAGFYLQQTLADLSAAHRNFSYTLTPFAEDGPIDQAVLRRYPSLSGWRVFLCGDPQIVQALKKKTFLAGAALADIQADAFLPSAT